MKTETINELDFFENTSIKLIENEVYASRKQLTELYNVPASSLSDVINSLKDDKLIENQDITNVRNNLNNRQIEYFNLDSIIAIGLRLRSDNAIKFQKWAIAQLMESIAWNHLDAKDNWR